MKNSSTHFILAVEKVCGESQDSVVQDENPAVVAGDKGEQAGYYSYSYYGYFQTPKDTERLISVNSMIDTWSTMYSVMVLVVGVVQVVVLKRLFNVRPPPANMKMRT